ncbi:hypothetical protein EV2_035416 [Malus domestica]
MSISSTPMSPPPHNHDHISSTSMSPPLPYHDHLLLPTATTITIAATTIIAISIIATPTIVITIIAMSIITTRTMKTTDTTITINTTPSPLSLSLLIHHPNTSITTPTIYFRIHQKHQLYYHHLADYHHVTLPSPSLSPHHKTSLSWFNNENSK